MRSQYMYMRVQFAALRSVITAKYRFAIILG